MIPCSFQGPRWSLPKLKGEYARRNSCIPSIGKKQHLSERADVWCGRSCTFCSFSLGALDLGLCFHSESVRSSSLCKLCTMSVLLFFLKGLCPEADLGKHVYLHVLLASPIPGALIYPPALMICSSAGQSLSSLRG